SHYGILYLHQKIILVMRNAAAMMN
ncbi:uncharacterized protein METZ01_LOCUS421262, partial [marine metagenome]